MTSLTSLENKTKGLEPVKCVHCDKTLFFISGGLNGGLEIKCNKCKLKNIFLFTFEEKVGMIKEERVIP